MDGVGVGQTVPESEPSVRIAKRKADNKVSAPEKQTFRTAIGSLVELFFGLALLALFMLFPVLWHTALAIIATFVLHLILNWQLGLGKGALAMVALVFLAALGATFANADVEVCFIISCCASTALFGLHSQFPADSLANSLVRRYTVFAFVLASVTGLLYVVSKSLPTIPPDSILEWGEHLETVDKTIHRIGRVSTILLVCLIATYFLSIQWKRKDGWFTSSWRWAKLSKDVLEKFSLVLACLSTFTFLAGGPSDSPLKELSKAQAEALSEYHRILWRVQIEIHSRLAFKIAQNVYDNAPHSAKQALESEDQLASRDTPLPYYAWNFHGAKAASLLAMEDGTSLRDPDLKRRIESALESERKADPITRTPATVSLLKLDAVNTEAAKLEKANDHRVPTWLHGIGSDVLSEIVGLVLSNDRIPILNHIENFAPLGAEVLKAAFDSVDDSATNTIRSLAYQVVTDKFNGKIDTLDAGITSAVTAMEQRLTPRHPTADQWKQAEKKELLDKRLIASARERFQMDLSLDIGEETLRAQKTISQYDSLTGKEDTLPIEHDRYATEMRNLIEESIRSGTPLEKLHFGKRRLTTNSRAGGISLSELKSVNGIRLDYESKISDFVYSNPDNVGVKSVLGNEAEKYRREGEQRKIDREAARAPDKSETNQGREDVEGPRIEAPRIEVVK